jgi:hypothetical protein
MLDSFKAALQAKLDWNNFYLYQHIKNTELFMSYGGLGGDLPAEHGKDAQGPNMNPVRGGVFKNYRPQQGVLSGYDILDLPRDLDPCKAQLQENWFTFNYVANFLRMPALFTNSEKRLRNAIRWMRVLSQAYPEDAAMSCVAYYLERRLADTPLQVLDGLRRAAVVKLKRSEYWRFRDGQFGFSAFLDGVIPALDTRVEALPLTELMKEAGRC